MKRTERKKKRFGGGGGGEGLSCDEGKGEENFKHKSRLLYLRNRIDMRMLAELMNVRLRKPVSAKNLKPSNVKRFSSTS